MRNTTYRRSSRDRDEGGLHTRFRDSVIGGQGEEDIWSKPKRHGSHQDFMDNPRDLPGPAEPGVDYSNFNQRKGR